MSFIIGTKQDMTQLFTDEGDVLPVTVIDIEGSVVAAIKTIESDGYNAVVIGYGKKNKANKAETGKYKKLGFVPRFVAEFRSDALENYEVGKAIDLEQFAESKVNISGITKGKGFAGVIKRWGFHGGPKTHGQSDRHRSPGSIGSGTTPGRVYKGKKMAGRMGTDKITVKNLKVIKVDIENNLLIVKGAVPGVKGGFIRISKSR